MCSCNKTNSEPQMSCRACKRKFHFSCVNLSPKLAKRVQIYYCVACEKNKNKTTIWRGVRARSSQLIDKEENYFEVERIISHRIDRTSEPNRRTFLVKWKGWDDSHNSWLLEDCLDGAMNLLQKYCRHNKLDYSSIIGLLGADAHDEGKFDYRNWVSIEQILSLIERFRRAACYKSQIKVERFTKPRKKDTIFLLELNHHCYTVLSIADDNLSYVADGTNKCEDPTIQAILKRSLKSDVSIVHFGQQTRVDYCGSSAVLIALEFVRIYRSGNWLTPFEITVPSELRKRIVKRLHKHHSKAIGTSQFQSFNNWTKCGSCGKSFRGGDKRKFLLHRCKT